MRTILLVHIVTASLGLLSGYAALAVAKGAPLHRRMGMLFVCVMLTMSVTGMLISAVEGVAPAINIPTALLTSYLVVTSLTTVRPAASRRADVAAMVMGLIVGLVCITLALVAIGKGGREAGWRIRWSCAAPSHSWGAAAIFEPSGPEVFEARPEWRGISGACRSRCSSRRSRSFSAPTESPG